MWMTVPTGMLAMGRQLPGLISAEAEEMILSPDFRPTGAVGVILQAQDGRGDVHLVALEVDDAVLLPVASAVVADGDAAVAVAAGMLLLRLDQAAFGLGLLVDPLEGGHSHVTAGGGSGL